MQYDAEVVVRKGERRVQRNGFTEFRLGFLVFVLFVQEVAGAVVRVCDQRVESDGFAVFGFGFTALPLVLERDAQIHMCVHEIGIYFTTTLARAVGIAGIEGQGCPTAAPSFGSCTQ